MNSSTALNRHHSGQRLSPPSPQGQTEAQRSGSFRVKRRRVEGQVQPQSLLLGKPTWSHRVRRVLAPLLAKAVLAEA